jgi:hypothetical protein
MVGITGIHWIYPKLNWRYSTKFKGKSSPHNISEHSNGNDHGASVASNTGRGKNAKVSQRGPSPNGWRKNA